MSLISSRKYQFFTPAFFRSIAVFNQDLFGVFKSYNLSPTRAIRSKQIPPFLIELLICILLRN
nr:MAG TPA: hypothetical protein [Caudoviricetes sp.]